jgi:hypothetical protein
VRTTGGGGRWVSFAVAEQAMASARASISCLARLAVSTRKVIKIVISESGWKLHRCVVCVYMYVWVRGTARTPRASAIEDQAERRGFAACPSVESAQA